MFAHYFSQVLPKFRFPRNHLNFTQKDFMPFNFLFFSIAVTTYNLYIHHVAEKKNDPSFPIRGRRIRLSPGDLLWPSKTGPITNTSWGGVGGWFPLLFNREISPPFRLRKWRPLKKPELVWCGCFFENRGFSPQIIHLFIGFSIIFTIHFGVPQTFWKHLCQAFTKKPSHLVEKNKNHLPKLSGL